MRKKADVKDVFANEAEFEEAYASFLETVSPVGKDVTDNHEKMDSCFRDYLDAFEKWVFRQAYEDGYVAAMSRARGMDKEDAVERIIRNIPCPSRMKRYQVSSSFGHHLYENEHDAIQTVMMLAPCYGMEILEGEVKAYLDIHGCYNAFPIVVQSCDF